ncbi:MAG TPA: hypothetical protein VIK91_08955, partial [Nannocystis sp.]
VRRMVLERIGDTETAHEITRFVNTTHGLVAAVTHACAVVYQRGARRWLRGVGEAAAQAFADLVVESGMPELGPSINALAWVLGPVIAVPYVDVVRGKPRLCLELVTVDRAEVRRHRSAPDVLDAVLYQRADGVFVEVDEEAWRFYTAQGEPLDGGAHDGPHRVGYCPAVPLRARPWLATDWYGELDHRGLCDAALEVAYLSAVGRWTRTQTSAPLTVVIAPDEKFAKLQAIGHPSRPLTFNATPPEVSVAVHNRTTDPRDYLAEIQALAAAAVVPYGLPPNAVTYSIDGSFGTSPAVMALPGVLALQRDAQAPFLRAAELALWTAACDVVRASDHRHARVLPPADVVEGALRVAFPDLADPDEQIKRLQAFEMALPHGLASAADVLMQARPELTHAQATEELDERLDEYTARIAALAERNVSADPARGVQSIAQLQGRIGGQASGEARREENTVTP